VPEYDSATLLENAFDGGHTCGVKGKNRSDNPHIPGSEEAQTWDRGWFTGQEVIAKGLAPKGKAKASKAKKGAETIPDNTPAMTDEDMPEDAEALIP
jgi:hypothetical protein